MIFVQGSADMSVYKYGRNGDAGVGIAKEAIAPIASYSFGVKGSLYFDSFPHELLLSYFFSNSFSVQFMFSENM